MYITKLDRIFENMDYTIRSIDDLAYDFDISKEENYARISPSTIIEIAGKASSLKTQVQELKDEIEYIKKLVKNNEKFTW